MKEKHDLWCGVRDENAWEGAQNLAFGDSYTALRLPSHVERVPWHGAQRSVGTTGLATSVDAENRVVDERHEMIEGINRVAPGKITQARLGIYNL